VRVVDNSGKWDPFNGIVLPGSSVPEAEGGRFPILHTGELARLYHGLPDGFSQTHKNVFQPRFGVAYALNKTTAIRGGIGAFANRTMINRDTALVAIRHSCLSKPYLTEVWMHRLLLAQRSR